MHDKVALLQGHLPSELRYNAFGLMHPASPWPQRENNWNIDDKGEEDDET